MKKISFFFVFSFLVFLVGCDNKPIEEEKPVEPKKEEYVTIKQFNETIKDIQSKQSKEWKEEMKSLKREFRDLSDDLKDIKDKKGD